MSVYVPTNIKQRMKDYEKEVDWLEEIGKMIAERIGSLDRDRAMQEVLKLHRDIPPAPKGTASGPVRKDRDSH